MHPICFCCEIRVVKPCTICSQKVKPCTICSQKVKPCTICSQKVKPCTICSQKLSSKQHQILTMLTASSGGVYTLFSGRVCSFTWNGWASTVIVSRWHSAQTLEHPLSVSISTCVHFDTPIDLPRFLHWKYPAEIDITDVPNEYFR